MIENRTHNEKDKDAWKKPVAREHYKSVIDGIAMLVSVTTYCVSFIASVEIARLVYNAFYYIWCIRISEVTCFVILAIVSVCLLLYVRLIVSELKENMNKWISFY